MAHEFTRLAQLEELRDTVKRQTDRAETEQRERSTRNAPLHAPTGSSQQPTAERHDAATAISAETEFRNAVGTVTPLARKARIEHARVPHPPIAHKRREDDQHVLIASVSDEFEIDTLLHTDDELSFRRPGVGADVLRKLRRGDWVIQNEIDLHGCRSDEAREMLSEFLRVAVKRGLRCVRVVHGKGLGSKNRQPVLKRKTKVWLAQREDVLAFCQARAAEGGSGALIVLLKPTARRQ